MGREVAAVAICSRSRCIWMSIRRSSESSDAAAFGGVRYNQFQIQKFPTSGDSKALKAIFMRGANALAVT